MMAIDDSATVHGLMTIYSLWCHRVLTINELEKRLEITSRSIATSLGRSENSHGAC
jgi:hypothetical protein